MTMNPRVLMSGFGGLFAKEILRFWRVAFQTVMAPVLGAFLYLLIFSHILADRVQVFDNVGYADFLVPGLVMMSVLQNAFANSSSSLVHSKVSGNIVILLLPPISASAFYLAYAGAATLRGVVVGAGVLVGGYFFASPSIASPLIVLFFALMSGTMMASLGIIAGLWSEKFDHMAAFQNFIIMPLTFLSGVFYSIQSLPPFWREASKLNPFFYMIDGFRYGFFNQSDIPVGVSAIVVLAATAAVALLALYLLKIGYKVRT